MTLQEWIVWGEDLQFMIFFTGLLGLMLLERWRVIRVTQASRQRWWANFVLTTINIAALGALPVSLISVAVFAQHHHWGLLHQISLTGISLVVATLLLRGFISWFTHLLMHKIPWFWRVHRVHHLDTELDVSTTVRFHPLEFVIGLLLGAPLTMLFGLSPWALVVYELLDVAVTLFSHSNIRLPQVAHRWLSVLIVTPNLHRVHHSAWQSETDSNYSAVFPVWDIVFGTYRPEPNRPLEKMTIGLDDLRDERAQQITWLLAVPFRSSTKTGVPKILKHA